MYHCTENAVSINGILSDWFITKSGVKQGDNLSLTLFAVYINELLQELNGGDDGITLGDDRIAVLAYADDIVLLSETTRGLQNLLRKLQQWCRRWHIIVNCGKTKVMHFCNYQQPQTDVQFKLGRNILDIVNEYKYLGVLMHFSLRYTTHLDNITKSRKRAVGRIICKYKLMTDMGAKTFTTLFQSQVVPILCYGNSVWGPTTKAGEGEKVLQLVARFYLALPVSATRVAYLGDMGWTPLEMEWTLNVVRLYNRMKMLPERLTRWVFDYVVENEAEWYNNLVKVLDDVGILASVTENKIGMRILKERLETFYANKWKEHVTGQSKLHTYQTFKKELKMEPYVMSNLPLNQRTLVASLRCGCLPLQIEIGQWGGEHSRSVPVEECICELCVGEHVEDEGHFLFHCEYYWEIRVDFAERLGYTGNKSEVEKYENMFARLFICGKYMAALWGARKRWYEEKESKKLKDEAWLQMIEDEFAQKNYKGPKTIMLETIQTDTVGVQHESLLRVNQAELEYELEKLIVENEMIL